MSEPTAKLTLLKLDGQEPQFVLSEGVATIGRVEINDIVIPDQAVSRMHAKLECQGTSVVLIDGGSANGTWVNGTRVDRCVLKNGDLIKVGCQTLKFETFDAAPLLDPSTLDPSTLDATTLDATIVASPNDPRTILGRDRLEVAVSDCREPRLVISGKSRTWEVPLSKDAIRIGRDPSSDVVLDTPQGSRDHAVIERDGDGFALRDLNSTNGTWVGKQRISRYILRDGDLIRIGTVPILFKGGFAAEDLGWSEPPRGVRRRPVMFIPGFMGSELWCGSDRVWPNPRYLFAPDIAELPGAHPFEARAVLSEVVIIPNLIKLAQYNRLGNYLEESLGYERGKDFTEFPYDWRQDIRASARLLALAIDAWQERSPDARFPITLIAHSMGCLVARYYVECVGGKDKVERLILMGGPHLGAPKAIGELCSASSLPFGLLGERLRPVLSSFPSMYQLLPSYACASDQTGSQINVFSDESWVPEARRPLLRDARRFRRELAHRSSVPTVSVFGYGFNTVTGLAVERSAEGAWGKVEVRSEPSGDSAVPESSAALRASEIHPVRQYHGSLYTDNDVKMRLKVELTR